MIALAYPFTGRWAVRNSPADRVPSHGTTRFGSGYAIDFVPVAGDGRSAPMTWRSWLRAEPPEAFTGFGRPVLAPVGGRVLAVHDGVPDHRARRGLPSVGYALGQRGRVAEGWRAVAGNHVAIDGGAGVVVLCHLRQGSITVTTGQEVRVGDVLGGCGNSGNSTEPHLHLQAMDRFDPEHGRGLAIGFPDGVPRGGTVVEA